MSDKNLNFWASCFNTNITSNPSTFIFNYFLGNHYDLTTYWFNPKDLKQFTKEARLRYKHLLGLRTPHDPKEEEEKCIVDLEVVNINSIKDKDRHMLGPLSKPWKSDFKREYFEFCRAHGNQVQGYVIMFAFDSGNRELEDSHCYQYY